MDLGFAGLIEEIEKRFGPFVPNLTLVMVLFGIVTWVLRVFLNIEIEIAQMKASSIRVELVLG